MIPIIIIAIIFTWAIYGMHVLDLHKPALESLSKPLAEWFAEPGNPVKALLWVGAIALSAASWWSPTDTLFNEMLPDFISISIAVIVIDELVGYRNRLERKQEIFEQIESPVRDVAVEAVRLARKHVYLDEALNQVTLRSAQLARVNLSGANLQGADLTGIDLEGAELTGVSLEGANLTGANLQKANLFTANLQGAELIGANLQKACLESANMENAEMLVADLKNAWLVEAILQRANFAGADLQGADLRDANLREADLRFTNLKGANLCDAILHGTDLREAMFDRHTMFTNGFDPIVAGAKLVEEDSTDNHQYNKQPFYWLQPKSVKSNK